MHVLGPGVLTLFSQVHFNGSIEALLRMSGYGDLIQTKQPLPPILVLGVGPLGSLIIEARTQCL